MPRPSQEAVIRGAIDAYVTEAGKSLPRDKPLTEIAMSVALGVSRTTLRKYVDTAAVDAARASQRELAQTVERKARRSYDEQLASRDHDIARLRKEQEALLSRLYLVEGNARRLNVDPAELYKPLLAPPRDQPGYDS